MANSLSYYRAWQTWGNIFPVGKRSFNNRCAWYKIISVTPKDLMKTQTFEKMRLHFTRKKVSSDSFRKLWSLKNFRQQPIRAHNSCDNYCASYKNISFGPKRLIERSLQKNV